MVKQNAHCSFCRKQAHTVGPLVEGPDEVYICRECAELCQQIVDHEQRRRGLRNGSIPRIASAAKVVEQLDRCIGGQQDAKRLLAAAVTRHYEALVQGGAATKSDILLIGPSQSSTLFLARAAAHIMDVPFVRRAASATEQQDEEVYLGLLNAANFDLEEAQRGIIYIEGVDQPAAESYALKMLRRAEGAVCLRGVRIDTSGILFICAGRFLGIGSAVVRERRNPDGTLGSDELIAFGMLPELAACFAAVIPVHSLDEETLLRVARSFDVRRMLEAST